MVSRKLDSFSLAALIRNPAMDSLKVESYACQYPKIGIVFKCHGVPDFDGY